MKEEYIALLQFWYYNYGTYGSRNKSGVVILIAVTWSDQLDEDDVAFTLEFAKSCRKGEEDWLIVIIVKEIIKKKEKFGSD